MWAGIWISVWRRSRRKLVDDLKLASADRSLDAVDYFRAPSIVYQAAMTRLHNCHLCWIDDIAFWANQSLPINEDNTPFVGIDDPRASLKSHAVAANKAEHYWRQPNQGGKRS